MDDKGVVPEPGVRVVHNWNSMGGIKGTITRDCGDFAYVKWDDEKYGTTSEDYSVIDPLVQN